MSHPNMKAAMVPNMGPNKGAVKLECRMLENVITAPVPKTG